MSWTNNTTEIGTLNNASTSDVNNQQQMPGMPDPVTEPPNQNLSSVQAANSQAMSNQVSTRTANVPPPNPLKPRAASVPFELPSANTSVGYAYDTQMLLHTSSTEHPECPARIKQIHRTLREQGLIKMMRLIPVRMVRKTEVLLVHSEDHWEKVEAISQMTPQDIIDSESYYEHLSLYVCPSTPIAAALSCGGVIDCALAVARGHYKKTLAIVRPPGHHAEPEEHMGFCFFNNVAVATRVVQQLTPLKKVMILDWDVHHGNGTQRAFLDDPSVLYISIHRYENGRFYPCGPFGGIESCGEGPGTGTSVNVPWPEAGMGDAEYLYAFQKIVMPIAMEFAPDLVIISAGFDAADGDDLGECHVTPAGYAHMTHMLASLAGGKLVVALEGGYNIESICASTNAVARILVGEAPPELPPVVANEVATELVWQVGMVQSKHWKSVDPKALEPKEDYGDAAVAIPDLLRMYREQYLFTTGRMSVVPLMEELEERFKTQVLCTGDIFDNKTMVVFVHEFGNVRVRLEGMQTCEMNLEQSYLIDATKALMDWVMSKGYSLVEVNTFPQQSRSQQVTDASNLGRELMVYLWDNYISGAKQIILVGHGPGCKALMQLLAARSKSITRRAATVIQVVGLEDIPIVPRDEPELNPWYYRHSLVVISKAHPVVANGRLLKRHGTIHLSDEANNMKLLITELPSIRAEIERRLNNDQAQTA